MALRVLIDTNIILDYILNREFYGEFAGKIISACEKGMISGCIAAQSVPNIFYILRKAYTVEERREILQAICEMFDIEGIDENKIQNALKNESFRDFEDCLQMECAKDYAANYIVTRNITDFANSVIPCLTPEAMCRMLDQNV